MTEAINDFPTDQHGWAELLPTRDKPAPLAENLWVQWVIVGAGLTGLACARRLGGAAPRA